MEWAELSGAEWTLPAARNKIGQDLVRPLSGAAQKVLTALPRGKFVFTLRDRVPLSGFGKLKKELDAACGVTGWTLHDLRRIPPAP
jgi:hypothetical protein